MPSSTARRLALVLLLALPVPCLASPPGGAPGGMPGGAPMMPTMPRITPELDRKFQTPFPRPSLKPASPRKTAAPARQTGAYKVIVNYRKGGSESFIVDTWDEALKLSFKYREKGHKAFIENVKR